MRRRRSGLLRWKTLSRSAAVLTALCALSASALSVPPPQFQLEYLRLPGAEDCPSMETVAGEVAAYLGRDPFSADAGERLRVTLQGTEGSSLVATIELVRPDGTIEGHQLLRSRRSECRQLVESLSLAISLALEVQTPSRPSPSLSEPIPTISTPTTVARSSSPPLILAVGAGPLGSIGLAPSPSLGVSLELEVRRGRYSLGLETQASLNSGMGVAGGSVAAQLLAGALVPCVHYWGVLGSCLSVTAGVVEGSAQNLSGAHRNPTPYLGLGGREFVELALSNHLLLRPVVVALEVPLARTTLQVGDNDVWTTSSVAGSLSATFLVLLP